MVARYWGPVFFLKHLNKNGGKNGGTVSVFLHYLYRNGVRIVARYLGTGVRFFTVYGIFI